MSASSKVLVAFNEILGVAPGNVPAYSNHKSSIFNIGQNYVYGVYTGFRWQCVEFARRWLILRKSCTFNDVPDACNMWNEIKHVERITDGEIFNLILVRNGTERPPKKDCLLIYSRSRRMPFGHVAIITDVSENFVNISEQNHLFHRWNNDFARQVEIRRRDGLHFLHDQDEIIGWMEIENDEQLKPFQAEDKEKIVEKYLKAPSTGFIGRIFGWNKREDLI